MTKFRQNYSKNNDIKHRKNGIDTLELADEYYEQRFEHEIGCVVNISETRIHLLTKGISSDAMAVYKKHMEVHGLKSFCKQFLLVKTPKIGRILQVALHGSRRVAKYYRRNPIK